MRSYANADNADVYGVEVEMRKNLGFIKGDFFNHLVIYANAAVMKGSVQFGGVNFNSPMQGQSPYLVNGGLGYTTDNNSLSFNVLYNVIGPRLKYRSVVGTQASASGNNIYESPRNVLDFQVSKKLISNRMELKLTVSDILAQRYTLYMKFVGSDPTKMGYNAASDKIINTSRYGTSVLLTIGWALK